MAAGVALLASACGSEQPTKVAGVAVDASPSAAVMPAVAPPPPPAGDAAIAAAPEQFDGPPPAAAPPPRQLTKTRVTPGPGTWAVVIGVNDYPGTRHDLRSAVADADDMNLALEGMGVPADHRLVLKDGQVTTKVLRTAAEWLVARAGPDSVAVFFFAGHVRKVGRTTEAMVAADGGTVTDAQLAGLLRPLQARRTWVVMAACFGGGFTEVLRPGTIVTGAAPADQEAYENLGLGRSYLVQYMVREAIIEERASDSVESAFEYARTAIAQRHPNRVPVQFDQADGPLDLRPPGVPRRPPTTSAPAAPVTPTTAPAADAGGGGGGGGGGSGGNPAASTTSSSTSTTTTTTPPRDRCKDLTKVVKCPSG